MSRPGVKKVTFDPAHGASVRCFEAEGKGRHMATMVGSDASRIADAIPEYEVERELGRGGLGVVYLGRHRRLDRSVAIKELPPAFAVDPAVRERFSNEAQTLAGLSHPHIVPIFDYVERDGLCLIVMEQLPGGSVWDRFTTDGLTPPTACAVVMACCAALQYAHGKGVLHLDVKPDNLMFDAEAAVKVTDFGIARVITGDRTMGTVDGQVLGTPAYMSPEQAKGDLLTPSSDVYAAGVMLYELLCGQLPWLGAQSASELLQQRLSEDPIPLGTVAPHVPGPLAMVVMGALSRDAMERHQRAEDLGVAIGEACVESWGPSWLDASGMAIFGSERLSRAARTTGTRSTSGSFSSVRSTGGSPVTTGPNSRADETTTSGRNETITSGRNDTITSGRHGTPGAPSTIHTGPTAAPRSSPSGWGAPAPAPPRAPGAPLAPLEFQAVRAVAAEPRIEGVDLMDIEVADLIGVEDVLDPPKPPWPAVAWTAALLFLAAVVAFIGIGTAPRDDGLAPGDVRLNGEDVAEGRLELDLSEEIDLRILDRQLATRVDEIELGFAYNGVAVTHASAPVRDGEATLDPGIAQRMVGGEATAQITLRSGDVVLREHGTAIRATQTWYLTLPFIGGLLLLLLGYANLESSLKPLRSGRTRKLSYIGAFLAGPLLGAGFVAMAGALGVSEPTLPVLVVVCVLAAASGFPAVRARVGVARRSRVRQAVARAEKSLGVEPGTVTGSLSGRLSLRSSRRSSTRTSARTSARQSGANETISSGASAPASARPSGAGETISSGSMAPESLPPPAPPTSSGPS